MQGAIALSARFFDKRLTPSCNLQILLYLLRVTKHELNRDQFLINGFIIHVWDAGAFHTR